MPNEAPDDDVVGPRLEVEVDPRVIAVAAIVVDLDRLASPVLQDDERVERGAERAGPRRDPQRGGLLDLQSVVVGIVRRVDSTTHGDRDVDHVALRARVVGLGLEDGVIARDGERRGNDSALGRGQLEGLLTEVMSGEVDLEGLVLRGSWIAITRRQDGLLSMLAGEREHGVDAPQISAVQMVIVATTTAVPQVSHDDDERAGCGRVEHEGDIAMRCPSTPRDRAPRRIHNGKGRVEG